MRHDPEWGDKGALASVGSAILGEAHHQLQAEHMDRLSVHVGIDWLDAPVPP